MSKEIKQEIKETVTKLANANLEFTIEDELEFAKVAVKNAEQKLREKEQEIEKLKVQIKNEKQASQIDIDNLNQACLDLNQENDNLLSKFQAKEQECEELNKLIEEAEEAPICFKCKEEPCIRQERDRYKKLSIDFKDVNKQLGYKIITLKQALDEISKILDSGTADTQTNNAKWLQQHYLARFCEIRNIINEAKDGE